MLLGGVVKRLHIRIFLVLNMAAKTLNGNSELRVVLLLKKDQEKFLILFIPRAK